MSQSKQNVSAPSMSRLGRCYALLYELERKRKRAAEDGQELPLSLTIAGREIKINEQERLVQLKPDPAGRTCLRCGGNAYRDADGWTCWNCDTHEGADG